MTFAEGMQPGKPSSWEIIFWAAILAVLLIIANSCALTKEQRVCNRQAKKVEKAVEKCPSMRLDTIYVHDTVTVSIPEVRVDTLVLRADTVTLTKDRWRVQIIQVGDSMAVDGGCDTDTIRVPISIPCPPQVAPIITKKAPLPWWKTALMWLGGLFILVLAYRAATTSR